MAKFELLCVTMPQKDFAKVASMNLHSDVVFANQCDQTAYEEYVFDGHTAKMISTQTRGVGINRNLALMYASADICLLADDDMVYADDLEQIVLSEFDAHPDADVFIFNTHSLNARIKQRFNPKTKKCGKLSRMPYGAIRIAFRLRAIQTKNIFFTTLFGGGCIFSAGEDSLFIKNIIRAGLSVYVSSKVIGTVDFGSSSWFTGHNEKFFYDKGALCRAMSPRLAGLWIYYYAFRYRHFKDVSTGQKIRLMKQGAKNYKKQLSYDAFINGAAR